MKNIAIILICIGILFGCGRMIDDGCDGNSTFFVKNESDKTLVFEIVSRYFNVKSDSIEVATNKVIQIGEEGGTGYNPIPSNRYSKISVFTIVNGKKNLAFTLNPVKDEKWMVERKKYDDSYCESRIYTLIVTQKDIP